MASSDERRAEWEAAGRRWAQWLRENLDRAGMAPADLVNGSGGRFDRATVSRWLAAKSTPSAESALLVGRLVGADPGDVLRGAGHDAVATVMAVAREAGLPPDDPIAELILMTGFEPRERQELLGMRAADLKRLAEDARAADDRMRALVEERKRSM